MSLRPGTRLGSCAILAAIGEGGRGEVYRAKDTSLKRRVAIKALPASVAADADRIARFQREAEVLTQLNHPNIAAIYGLEQSGATPALVMELVDGPTLADRLSQGAIPVDEALRSTSFSNRVPSGGDTWKRTAVCAASGAADRFHGASPNATSPGIVAAADATRDSIGVALSRTSRPRWLRSGHP